MYAQKVTRLFVMVLGGNSASLNRCRCVKGSSYKIDLDLEIQGKINFIACVFYLCTGGMKVLMEAWVATQSSYLGKRCPEA